MALVLDIQGFFVNNTFEAKEISLTFDGTNVYTFLVKPNFRFNQVSDADRRTIKWLEANFHCLNYSSGFISSHDLSNILTLFIKHSGTSVVYVKGAAKKDFIAKYLNEEQICIINLEAEGNSCVKMVKSYHGCAYHANAYAYCSTFNVKMLFQYVLSLNVCD